MRGAEATGDKLGEEESAWLGGDGEGFGIVGGELQVKGEGVVVEMNFNV